MPKAKIKRKRNQILSDESGDEPEVVALSPIQLPAIPIADGPFWSVWVFWDCDSRERFNSTSTNEDASKFFEKMKECKIGYHPPAENTYKMVQIVKIDTKDLPCLLRLKVNILPLQKTTKKDEKEDLWNLLVHNDLGVILSKIVLVKSILIVDGPTSDLKKIITLNNKIYNRFSRVFLNYNENPVIEPKDFIEKKCISAARVQCSVFHKSTGNETNMLMRLMPTTETHVVKKSPTSIRLKERSKISERTRIDDANNELLAGGFIRSDNEEQEKSISNIFEESDQIENSQSQNVVDVRIEDEVNNEEISITIANPSPTTPKSRFPHRSPRSRANIPPTKKNDSYRYEKLMELKDQLDEVKKQNRSGGRIIKLIEQRYVYGIVQTVENHPKDLANTYRIRIKDETMDGVLVRLHSPDSPGDTGVQPAIDDIIRIHRITVQFEMGDHLNMVLSTCHHRNYVLFDPSLKNINGPVQRQSLGKNYTFEKSDIDRVKELRRVLKSDYDIATNSISSSSFERKSQHGEKSSSPLKEGTSSSSVCIASIPEVPLTPPLITIDDDSPLNVNSMHSAESKLSSSEEDMNKQKRNETPPSSPSRMTRSQSKSPQKETRRRKGVPDPEDGDLTPKKKRK